ncbi:hypothetical protein HFD88_002848 [Aspergillus terreus]|nr:hypothetical protein HFD88_002848 [Aspergillus terreus]
MEVMCGSVCDNIAFATRFGAITTTVGLGVTIVSAYQGIQALKLIAAQLEQINGEIKALSTLKAIKAVPQQIHDTISEGLNKKFNDHKSHWFFVYHPDTFWTPGFRKLVETNELDRRFGGYTDQLDSLILFLSAVRKEIEEKEQKAWEKGKRCRPVKFHIIIPVHQLTVITEYLQFPADLGDFVVEGKTYSNQELAWLNVPPWQEKFLDGIGNWKPPSPTLWDEVLDLFGCKYPRLGEPRLLGSLPGDGLDSDDDDQTSNVFFDIEGPPGDLDLLPSDPQFPPPLDDRREADKDNNPRSIVE